MSELESTEPQAAREFENLVREHQAGLRAFIRALGVDEAWVDDLAQEAFIVAFRRLDDFETGTDFGKWLRRIARNLAANERRKSARRSRLLPFAVADVLLDRGRAHDAAETEFDRLLPALQECVGQLPPRSRELLHRRYTAGENAGALARELRTTAEAVRQNLLRIRIAVKECIYYLDRNAAVSGLQDYFCSGPTPAVAKGKTRTEQGRRLFNATTVTIPDANKPKAQPTNDVKIIFPI
jgi:RNA polymerase sigma-70 factor (ECF subfamily)